MLDRSYLMPAVPKQIIWGEDDIVIPVSHARIAHEAMPDSRLKIFESSGHMPFHDHPEQFVESSSSSSKRRRRPNTTKTSWAR